MTLIGIKNFFARPWVRRSIPILFLALVAILLIKEVRSVEWGEVFATIQNYSAATLIAAAVLSLLSYFIYSSFDLIGRRYVNAQIPASAAMSTAFISYAFNQSLGALVGAIAFRVRLYSRLGLNALQISKMIMLSVITNWLGYATVAGGVFMFGLISLPHRWDIGQRILHLIGAVMLASAIGYMLLCAFSTRREFVIKSQPLQIPSLRMASVQWVASIIHWPVEAAIIYVLLHDRVDFLTVLGALLINAIAGVLLHIPAALGVLETIFVGLLRGRVPTSEVLAAILVFRAFYYLAPLGIASLIYMRAEAAATAAFARAKNQVPPRRLGRLSPTEK